VVCAVSGLGAAVLVGQATSTTGTVTDPEQGIVIPADKEADIQDIEGDTTSPNETVSSIDTANPDADLTPDDAPTSVPAAITSDTDSSGDLAVPMSDAILTNPTNTYEQGDTTQLTDVYAGADGQDPNDGLLVQVTIYYDTGDGDTYYMNVPGAGALTLTSFSGSTLYFSSASGGTGSFNTSTQQLSYSP